MLLLDLNVNLKTIAIILMSLYLCAHNVYLCVSFYFHLCDYLWLCKLGLYLTTVNYSPSEPYAKVSITLVEALKRVHGKWYTPTKENVDAI